MTFSLTVSDQLKEQLGWYTVLQLGSIFCREWRLLQNPLPFFITGLIKGSLLYAPSLYRRYTPDAIQWQIYSLAQRVQRLILRLDAWISSRLRVRSYEELIATGISTQDYSNIELIRYCICAETPVFFWEAAVDQGSGRVVRHLGLRILVWTDFGGWLIGLLLFQKIAKKIRLEG